MNNNLVVIVFGVLCLTAVKSSPVDDVGAGTVQEKALHAYSVGNQSNSTEGSSFETIMQEIAARKAKEIGDKTKEDSHSISKRALGCSETQVAYGSTNGTAFSDFTSTNPWPCGVDITQFTVGHGSVIDSIQMTYKTVDKTLINGPRRGGGGGTKTTITLEDGERITGVSGLTCRWNVDFIGTLVQQLIFFSEKPDGQKVVYGPYGAQTYFSHPTACRMFSVNAKINSIFGRAGSYNNRGSVLLGAIGFYYEDESNGSQNTAA